MKSYVVQDKPHAGLNPKSKRAAGEPPNGGNYLPGLAIEGSDGRSLVVLNVKYSVELGDLQEIMNLLGQVEQLEFAILITNAGESADQFANPRAVNVCDIAEVEENLLVSLSGKFLDGIAQNDTAFAECDTPTEIDNGYTVYLT
jgi:hypothetical protein